MNYKRKLMSHIVEFSISELTKRKQNYSQKLNKDVNIFFGLNGSGKTSLLKILHSAMSGDTSILRNVPFKHAEVKLYSIGWNKEFNYQVEQMHSTTNEKKQLNRAEILYSSGEDITDFVEEIVSLPNNWKISPKNTKLKGLRHSYLPVSRPYLTKRPERLPLSEARLDLLFAQHLQDLWRHYSTDMLSNIRKVQEDGLANILKTILSAAESNGATQSVQDKPIKVEVAYKQMCNFLSRQNAKIDILGSRKEFTQRYKKDLRLQQVVSDIHAVEKEIEQTMAPRQKLQQLIQKMFSHKQVEFTDSNIEIKTEEDTSLGLNLLSSGERQLMLIFLETFLAGESTILIDEPEMSMHIDWQLELVSAMQQLNPKAQLILATHSPEIMANVADDKIFRLDYE